MAKSTAEKTSQLPLLYQQPIVLDKRLHNKVSLRQDWNYSFAAKINAVPVNLIELPEAMRFYPIAFTANEQATPLAILGLRDNENLFVNANGKWQDDTYIPAYVRRYPFIFSTRPDNDNLTLCIDDANGILQNDKSNALFNDDGTPGTATERALEFCKSYQAASDQTEQFAKALQASGVLVDRRASVQMPDGQALNLAGFRQIDQEKYYNLPAETLQEWHKNSWTASVYAHLFSTANWCDLVKMMQQRDAVV